MMTMRKKIGYMLMILGFDIGSIGALAFQSLLAILASAILMIVGVYYIQDGEANHGKGN